MTHLPDEERRSISRLTPLRRYRNEAAVLARTNHMDAPPFAQSWIPTRLRASQQPSFRPLSSASTWLTFCLSFPPMAFRWILFLTGFASSLLLTEIAHAHFTQWEIRKVDDREYVTLESLRRFYGFPPTEKDEKKIVLQSGTHRLEGAVGSKEFRINHLKFILSFPIIERDNEALLSRIDLTKLIEPVLRPGRIRGNRILSTIILDAGHGGHDPGARSPLGLEKEFALDTALRAREILQKAGFQVVMTRSSDRFIPLEERARFANRFQNAIFVSIHYNAGKSNSSGIETYTLAPRHVPSTAADGPSVSDSQPMPGNVNDTENMALATAMHSALVKRSRLPDRGIKRARFVVIRETTIPGVLLELGFLSNPREARIIASPAYRQQLAVAIARGVLNYRAAIRAQSLAPGTENNRLLERLEAPSSNPASHDTGPKVLLPQAP